MKILSKYAVLCIPFLLLSCAKEEPAQDDFLTETIDEIVSVRYSNVTVDTAWVMMEPMEWVFDNPVRHLDIGDPFEEVKDSIQIDLTLPSFLELRGELQLPVLYMSDPYVWFNKESDHLYVDKFPYSEGFRSVQRPDIAEQYEGLISKMQIDRKYQRIYYKADVQVVLKGNNGGTHIQEGNFYASKMGEMSTAVKVW